MSITNRERRERIGDDLTVKVSGATPPVGTELQLTKQTLLGADFTLDVGRAKVAR